MKTVFFFVHLCGLLCLLGFMNVIAKELDNLDTINCPIGWVQLHRGCYLFASDSENWQTAHDNCKKKNGELVSIQSMNERNELEKYMQNVVNEDVTKWWAGFKRETQKGDDWRWLDGEVVSPLTPWTDYRRKTRSGQMCGFLELASQVIKVSSMSCSSAQAYICEFHSITQRPQVTVTTPFTAKHGAPKTTIFNVIRGATIIDNSVVTSRHGDTIGDGEIHGVSKANGQQTSVSGGLFSSMMTVLSTGDKNTSPQVASTQDDNVTVRPPITTNIPVTLTESNNERDNVEDRKVHERGTTPKREVEPMTTTMTIAPTLPTATPPTATPPTATPPTATPPTTPATPPPPTTTATTETDDVGTPAPRFTINNEKSSYLNRTQEASPTVPPPTQASWTRPDTPSPTMVDWVRSYQDYEGCYIPGTGGSLRNTVRAAQGLYPDDLTSCPFIQIGSIKWKPVMAGNVAKVLCSKGQGYATFQCGITTVCWEDEPDITQCASKKLQAILRKTEDPVTGNSVGLASIEETLEQTIVLSRVVEVETTTMEDVIVTSRLLTAMTYVRDQDAVEDKEQVKLVVQNVIKTGSTLVSTNKSAMWEDMSPEDTVRSASSLIVAIEIATSFMAEMISEPATIIQKTDNIEVQISVVDVEKLARETKFLVYGSSQSQNSFSIPVETLRRLSKGGLAKAVFLTYYSMADIFSRRFNKRTTPRPKHNSNLTKDLNSKVDMTRASGNNAEEDDEKKTEPKIVSVILSASVGRFRSPSVPKLPKAVTFTMSHTEEVDAKYTPLCSFWDLSLDSKLGFWSQDGCRVLRTNKSHTTCECDHMTNFAILLDVHGMELSETHQSLLRLVTIIGCIISCVALLASWITFQCFTSLQGERNSIHKNLAFTLFIAEILFVFGIDQAQHQIACSIIAGFLHFFFLAAFTWMFIEGLHIIFMLVQVFDASRSRLPYYYLTGYGAPVVVIGISCIFNYEGYGTDKYCWLTTDQYFVWAFAGPVALILLVNAAFLTYAMSTVCRHSDYVFNAKEKSSGSGIRTWVQGALALEVLLGLTWTLGYFLINDDSLPLAYIFAILNSLQGLFIFVFHCVLNKKAQKEYRQVVRHVVQRSPSSITTQSTITKRTNHTNNSHELNNSPTNSHQKLNTTNSHTQA